MQIRTSRKSAFGHVFRATPSSAARVGLIAFTVFTLSTIPAYITHFIWMLTTLMATDPAATGGQMVLAIMGVLMPPVGVVHGFVLWF